MYIEFAKAFDKVPHKRLLSKLKGYGIKGKIYDWIKKTAGGNQWKIFTLDPCNKLDSSR